MLIKNELIKKFETLMGTKIPESGDLVFLPFLMGAAKMTHLTEYESVDVMTFLLLHIIASAKATNTEEVKKPESVKKFEKLMGLTIPKSGDLVFKPFLVGVTKNKLLTEIEKSEIMAFLIKHIISISKEPAKYKSTIQPLSQVNEMNDWQIVKDNQSLKRELQEARDLAMFWPDFIAWLKDEKGMNINELLDEFKNSHKK